MLALHETGKYELISHFASTTNLHFEISEVSNDAVGRR